MDRHSADYYLCDRCGYLQTQEPFWLDEAYERSITIQDTGLLSRNIRLSRLLTIALKRNFAPGAVFLDYGAGYGVLTRLMRDIGFDYRWFDPYTDNLFAVGFEGSMEKGYDAISAFEVLEHLVHPYEEFALILEHTDTLILSTELRPAAVPSLNWPYYAFEHGQHVGFFDANSLKYLADMLGVRLFSDNHFFHVMTRRPNFRFIPRSPRIRRVLFPFYARRTTSLTLTDSQQVGRK
jgi:hypothetical protein